MVFCVSKTQRITVKLDFKLTTQLEGHYRSISRHHVTTSRAVHCAVTLQSIAASFDEWCCRHVTENFVSRSTHNAPFQREFGGHNPPPCRIRTQCTMSFYGMLQERGFWKPNFRIGGRKPPDITHGSEPPCKGGSEPGGYVRGFTFANPEI